MSDDPLRPDGPDDHDDRVGPDAPDRDHELDHDVDPGIGVDDVDDLGTVGTDSYEDDLVDLTDLGVLDDLDEALPEPGVDDGTVGSPDQGIESRTTGDEPGDVLADDPTQDRRDDELLDLADDELDSAYPADLGGTLDDLGVDPAAFASTMQVLGLDAAADGRSIVVTLERLGVDAHLEFGDVDRIATHLAEGADIRLASGHVLAGLDDRTDEALLEHDGDTVRLPLQAFEDAWTDHGFESVVARGDDRVIVFLPISGPTAHSGGMSG